MGITAVLREQFQSTHPRRVRHLLIEPAFSIGKISIHAPAKGATRIYVFWKLFRQYFNPRTREGCDKKYYPFHPIISYFNPRTREGCDLYAPTQNTNGNRFQSTHPRRVRHEQLRAIPIRIDISIHAPAKGATLGIKC